MRQPPAGEYLGQSLASYVTAVDFADLPGPVVEKAKHQPTYFLGLALAGYPSRSSQDGRKLARVLRRSGGSASIIGETFTAQPLDAAFANCARGTFRRSPRRFARSCSRMSSASSAATTR